MREKIILDYLNNKYKTSGWSINKTRDTLNDINLNKNHSYYLLSQHPHSKIVLVVELEDYEQQQKVDFYINNLKIYCKKNNTVFGEIICLAFNKENLIILDLVTDISQ